MSLVINTNLVANTVRNTLTTNQSNLQKSLARLSSGSKILDPTDDAGGLAVATKLAATLNRNARTQQNVQNAISFLQVQDGAIAQATNILDRMSELKTMTLDPTKNSDDIANYDAEFTQLQAQLSNIKQESFNGINLFNATASLTVYTTEEGDASGEPSVTATRTGLFQEVGNITYGGSTGSFAVQEYNSKVDYSAAGTNEIATASSKTFVKSTAADGSVRIGFIADDAGGEVTAAAAADESFADAVGSGAIVEITNVDSLYDHEAGVVKADVFYAGSVGAGLSTHAAGSVVFDDASGDFFIAAGQSLNYTDATQADSAIHATNPGEFVKLPGYAKVTDYDAYSTSETYETGDIVAQDGSLWVAEGTGVAAGGAIPSGTNAAWTELTSVAVSGADLLTTSNTLSNYSVGDFTTFIQSAATARAQNGAEVARLESSLSLLKTNQGNLDAARSRLADVDVALESTNLAKQNILVQSAAAMLSQANASQNVALQLLG
jgi:flagellin